MGRVRWSTPPTTGCTADADLGWRAARCGRAGTWPCGRRPMIAVFKTGCSHAALPSRCAAYARGRTARPHATRSIWAAKCKMPQCKRPRSPRERTGARTPDRLHDRLCDRAHDRPMDADRRAGQQGRPRGRQQGARDPLRPRQKPDRQRAARVRPPRRRVAGAADPGGTAASRRHSVCSRSSTQRCGGWGWPCCPPEAMMSSASHASGSSQAACMRGLHARLARAACALRQEAVALAKTRADVRGHPASPSRFAGSGRYVDRGKVTDHLTPYLTRAKQQRQAQVRNLEPAKVSFLELRRVLMRRISGVAVVDSAHRPGSSSRASAKSWRSLNRNGCRNMDWKPATKRTGCSCGIRIGRPAGIPVGRPAGIPVRTPVGTRPGIGARARRKSTDLNH